MIYNFVIEDSAQVSIIMDYLMDTTKLQLLRDINASNWFNVATHTVSYNEGIYSAIPYDSKNGAAICQND